MNYDVIDGPTLGKKLKSNISGANSHVKLAVAFIGNGAVDLLGGGRMNQVQIVCDYLSGGTNPSAVEALTKVGAEVKHLDGLHAKIGIVGDVLSFVGSSNLSKNGMSDDPQINQHERVVVFEGIEKTVAQDWQTMWDLSSKISAKMKKTAAAAWKLRQRHKAIEATAETQPNLIEVLVSSPDILDALNVHMVVYKPLTKDEEAPFKAGEAKVNSQNSESVEAYWNWEEFPDKGFLVDFEMLATGEIDYNGLYFRDTSKYKDAKTADGPFQAAAPVHSMEKIKCGRQDQARIKKAFSRYQIDYPADGAWCFPISELSKYLEAAE